MINFPSAPVNGQQVSSGAVTWEWSAATQTWDLVSSPDGAALEALEHRNAAAVSAEAAADALAEAEAARDIALAALANTGEAVIDALIDDEPSAIAFSAISNRNFEMKVKDASNPANNRVGDLLDFIANPYAQAKLCLQADGQTYKWAPHNIGKQTNNLALNVTGGTTAAVTDSDGGNTATRLTSNSVVLSAFNQVAVGSSAYNGFYHTQEYIVEAGTGPWCYINFNDGADHRVWFNTATWALGTTEAGILNAAVYTTRADGTALPASKRRLVATYKLPTDTATIRLGQCNADNTVASTVGHTIIAEKLHYHLGNGPADAYFENTGATIKFDVPYDYGSGQRAITIEAGGTYVGLWSDDASNAAWVKTNITADGPLTSGVTGPHGDPCSKLTATAPNGTCLQSVVSGPTSQSVAICLRRGVGTGTVEITSDNGATWTDVTSQLSSVFFRRFTLGATTNPTFGVRVSTNGDVVHMALANAFTGALMGLPRPTYGTTGARTGEQLIIPTNLLTAGTAWTAYMDVQRMPGPGTPDDAAIRFGNAAATQELVMNIITATGAATITAKDGVTTKGYPIYKLQQNERMEVTLKAEANKHIFSFNGEPNGQIATVGMPAVEQLKLGQNACYWIRRILIVPRAVDRDEVRTWRFSGRDTGAMKSWVTVAYDSDPLYANTTMNREPLMAVISDDGETADVLYTWMQKHDVGHHSEAPGRCMGAVLRFTKSAESVEVLVPPHVIYQPAGWAGGTQHSQSPSAIIFQSGPYQGQAMMLISVLENPTFVPDKRSIYMLWNETGGRVPSAWTVPVKIVDTPNGQYHIIDSGGTAFVLPPDHPVAPNRIVYPLYGSVGGRVLYSDDWGTTWLQGNLYSSPGIATDEMGLTMWPDGTLHAIFRVTTAGSTTLRYWGKSVDGGINLVDQGALPGFAAVNCSVGLRQLDPTGATGPYGKIVMSHPVQTANRFGGRLSFATDAAMTFGNSIDVVKANATRYLGYSCVVSLFGGSHIGYGVEGGTVPFNTDNTCYAGLCKMP